MKVFLDFEASSLRKNSYPIEVGWVFENGRAEDHLIRPAPDWREWDIVAEAIHGISRATLLREGEPHEAVARHMVDCLSGCDILASAPSWDGKWLSALLRAAGLPRRTLTLRDSGEARRETAQEILSGKIAADVLERATEEVLTLACLRSYQGTPKRRALADAQAERDLWLAVREAAWDWLRECHAS